MKCNDQKNWWLVPIIGAIATFIFFWAVGSSAQTVKMLRLECIGIHPINSIFYGPPDSEFNQIDMITSADTPETVLVTPGLILSDSTLHIQLSAGVSTSHPSFLAIYGKDANGDLNGFLIKFNQPIKEPREIRGLIHQAFLRAREKSWADAEGMLRLQCGSVH